MFRGAGTEASEFMSQRVCLQFLSLGLLDEFEQFAQRRVNQRFET